LLSPALNQPFLIAFERSLGGVIAPWKSTRLPACVRPWDLALAPKNGKKKKKIK
jgi:hypothetical protein